MNMFTGLFHKLVNNQTGSTLVQIPITMAIIGGLVAFSAGAADALPETRDVKRAADARQVSVALELYGIDHVSYPRYTGTHAQLSWDILEDALEHEYIQELPMDPQYDEGVSYRYWSNGQEAKIFYYSEVEEEEKERWVY